MVQSLWKQSCRKILSYSSNLPLKAENSDLLWHCANSIWCYPLAGLPQHEEGQIVHKWAFACKITLVCKSYTHASLPAIVTVHACSSEASTCAAPLPFHTSCSSWGSLSKLQGCSNKGEVSEVRQTSLHTSMLGTPPARAWGRDQHTVGVLTIPCLILLHCTEPESKWWEGEQLVSTPECLRVNSERFVYFGVCIKKQDSWKRYWSKYILIKIVVLLRMLNLLIIIYEIKDWLPF